jgi:hypothetical protein
MAFGQGGAILRPDLRGVVEEAFLQSALYIGAKVAPPMPVPNMAGQYPVITKLGGDLLRNEVKSRGPRSAYARVARAWQADTFTTQEYGLESIVDDAEARNLSRFFDVEAFEIRRDIGQVQLAHEVRVSNLIMCTSATTGFSFITSATAYTNANRIGNSGYDIGLDIDLAKQAIQGRGENVDNLTVVMSFNNFLRARGTTMLQNRIRGTISTDALLVLSEKMVADALNVKEVLVGRAAYDASPSGAAAVTMTNIWPDTMIWVGTVAVPSGPEQYFSGGVVFTIYWEQDASMWQVESYRQEEIRSEIIRARHNTAEKIVLSAAGEVLQTQYS